ncbi:excisionase family DNA binding protein [Tamaricihabitans halophyticus]|uniref:Excisionase family DNA binding protein n=1 Tax=Tamaricihabitans halophyticus TaxID=1262583 RepID=A0A4R2R4N2_9PSEU|nr:helix-turn-helix domain-containing protein [Tamaricihabitans halophyticus]TCP56967.1 excisionase family DNA binding protein [Tamaricihabitans halophyticus]
MATADEIRQLAATLANLADKIAEREREQPREPERAMPERLLLTVEEAAQYLGVGRTLMYDLIRNGQIASVQINTLRRVSRNAVDEYAARVISQQNAA